MAEDTTTVDLRVLGRQIIDMRLKLGQLEAKENERGRDIKVLLTMTQNLDEAVKDINRQFGELISAFNSRLGPIEAQLDRLTLEGSSKE